MLARDAENLYWMARYLERADNTARLIIKITDTLLDLPKDTSLGWPTILQVSGLDGFYKEHNSELNENNIMHFLIADKNNPSSILTCVKYARENARTLRELLPEELWERVNGLYLYIENNLKDATKNRRNKYLFLQNIITQRHALIGLISCTMEQDLAYHFLKLGRSVERADMTTRIMDVNYAVSLPETHPLYEVTKQTLWASILKTLSAFQTYRRLKTFHVNMPDVIDFLFTEKRFPRSVSHCINEIEASIEHMPKNTSILETISTAKSKLFSPNTKAMDIAKLHEHIDLSQQHLNIIHSSISAQYFDFVEQAEDQKVA